MLCTKAESSPFKNIKSILNSIGGADSSFQIATLETTLAYSAQAAWNLTPPHPVPHLFFLFFSHLLVLDVVEVVAQRAGKHVWTEAHCKQRNRHHYKKETDGYFILSFPPESFLKQNNTWYFFPTRRHSNIVLSFPIFSNSTRVELSETKNKTKKWQSTLCASRKKISQIFWLSQCCTKVTILAK